MFLLLLFKFQMLLSIALCRFLTPHLILWGMNPTPRIMPHLHNKRQKQITVLCSFYIASCHSAIGRIEVARNRALRQRANRSYAQLGKENLLLCEEGEFLRTLGRGIFLRPCLEAANTGKHSTTKVIPHKYHSYWSGGVMQTLSSHNTPASRDLCKMFFSMGWLHVLLDLGRWSPIG